MKGNESKHRSLYTSFSKYFTSQTENTGDIDGVLRFLKSYEKRYLFPDERIDPSAIVRAIHPVGAIPEEIKFFEYLLESRSPSVKKPLGKKLHFIPLRIDNKDTEKVLRKTFNYSYIQQRAEEAGISVPAAFANAHVDDFEKGIKAIIRAKENPSSALFNIIPPASVDYLTVPSALPNYERTVKAIAAKAALLAKAHYGKTDDLSYPEFFKNVSKNPQWGKEFLDFLVATYLHPYFVHSAAESFFPEDDIGSLVDKTLSAANRAKDAVNSYLSHGKRFNLEVNRDELTKEEFQFEDRVAQAVEVVMTKKDKRNPKTSVQDLTTYVEKKFNYKERTSADDKKLLRSGAFALALHAAIFAFYLPYTPQNKPANHVMKVRIVSPITVETENGSVFPAATKRQSTFSEALLGYAIQKMIEYHPQIERAIAQNRMQRNRIHGKGGGRRSHGNDLPLPPLLAAEGRYAPLEVEEEDKAPFEIRAGAISQGDTMPGWVRESLNSGGPTSGISGGRRGGLPGDNSGRGTRIDIGVVPPRFGRVPQLAISFPEVIVTNPEDENNEGDQ